MGPVESSPQLVTPPLPKWDLLRGKWPAVGAHPPFPGPPGSSAGARNTGKSFKVQCLGLGRSASGTGGWQGCGPGRCRRVSLPPAQPRALAPRSASSFPPAPVAEPRRSSCYSCWWPRGARGARRRGSGGGEEEPEEEEAGGRTGGGRGGERGLAAAVPGERPR